MHIAVLFVNVLPSILTPIVPSINVFTVLPRRFLPMGDFRNQTTSLRLNLGLGTKTLAVLCLAIL
jgi:hypothetical protein